MDTIGRRIMEAREALGYTQAQLAERVPCNPQTVSNWETARRQPRYADLLRLAEILARPVSWLLGEDAGAGWDEVQAGFDRATAELARIKELLGERPPRESAGDRLVPVAGYVAAGPRAELVDEPSGWRLLAAAQADGVRVYRVRGDAHHPVLQDGDLIGIAAGETAAAGHLVQVTDSAGARLLKQLGADGRLLTVNPVYAPVSADGYAITGVVRWQQRELAGARDAAAEAAELLRRIEQAESEVERIEQRLERGDGQWTELNELCERIASDADMLKPVYGSRALAPAARALGRVARALGEQGQYPAALDSARRAADYYQRIERVGERSREALNNLYNLSQLALFLGDLELAEATAGQAAECDDWRVRWKALKNLAEIRVNYRAGGFDAEVGGDILEIADAHAAEDPVEANLARAVARELRGNAWLTHGDADRAAAEADQELAAAEAAGLPYRVANALLNQAQCAVARGQAAPALAALARAGTLTAAQDLGDLEALRLAHLAAAEALGGEPAAARVTLHRAMRRAAALGSPRAGLFAELAGLVIARRTGDRPAIEDHGAAARGCALAMRLEPYLAVIDRLARESGDDTA